MPAVATTAAFGKQNISQAPTTARIRVCAPIAYVVRFLPRDDALLPHPDVLQGTQPKERSLAKALG
jgi:hypothetical protein